MLERPHGGTLICRSRLNGREVAPMKYHQLRALVAISQHGTIRGAARSLALSQTALTKAIRELEIDIQAAVLHRSAQGIRLTQVGSELLRHAKLILAEIEDARETVRALVGSSTPSVSVAVTPAFSMLCLHETIERFRVRFPGASLSIRDAFLSRTLQLLREGSIDVAITALMPDVLGFDLAFEGVGDLDIAIAAGRNKYPTKIFELANLQAATWLLESSVGGISEAVRQWLLKHDGALPSCIVDCPSSMAQIVLLVDGNALAPVPRALFAIPWFSSLLQEVQVDAPNLSIPFGIALRKDSRLDAATEWFVESARLVMHSKGLAP